MLLLSIPYSVLSIIAGFREIEEGIVAGGFRSYLGIIGVVAGFVLTTIGAVRVFGR